MNKSSSLSTGAIVGIAVGGVCLLIIVFASICFFVVKNKQKLQVEEAQMEMEDMGNV